LIGVGSRISLGATVGAVEVVDSSHDCALYCSPRGSVDVPFVVLEARKASIVSVWMGLEKHTSLRP
jgi:hypothetical protein